ncbi:MAG: OmpA family protein [Phycisphaerales bacterium]|jgi:outer membrane protein OmpA-like peptidoglycan-associated protein
MNGFKLGAFRRTGLMAAVIAVGAAMLLGGCNDDKKKLDAATQESSELREKNASLEAQLGEKSNRIAELEGRLSTMQTTPVTPGGDYTDGPTGGGRKTTRGNGGGDDSFKTGDSGRPTATVSGDVLFASGQTTLKPEAKKALDKIAGEIKRKYRNEDVRVEGYTDSDPIRKSKWASNEALSQARAEAVRKYLVSKGISEGRVSAVGKGSANPRSTKALSRRVEIVITN